MKTGRYEKMKKKERKKQIKEEERRKLGRKKKMMYRTYFIASKKSDRTGVSIRERFNGTRTFPSPKLLVRKPGRSFCQYVALHRDLAHLAP